MNREFRSWASRRTSQYSRRLERLNSLRVAQRPRKFTAMFRTAVRSAIVTSHCRNVAAGTGVREKAARPWQCACRFHEPYPIRSRGAARPGPISARRASSRSSAAARVQTERLRNEIFRRGSQRSGQPRHPRAIRLAMAVVGRTFWGFVGLRGGSIGGLNGGPTRYRVYPTGNALADVARLDCGPGMSRGKDRHSFFSADLSAGRAIEITGSNLKQEHLFWSNLFVLGGAVANFAGFPASAAVPVVVGSTGGDKLLTKSG